MGIGSSSSSAPLHCTMPEPHPHALLRAAIRHHRTGALNDAASVLDRLLADAPQDPRALLLLALVRDAQDSLPAAEALYRHYLALHPDDGFALNRLGHVLRRRGNDAAACLFFARAVAMQPGHAPALNDFGAALYRLGDAQCALAAFGRAVALDPTDSAARCNRGKLLAAMHRSGEAAAAFRSVLDLNPRSASDWHDRGVACFQLGDLAAAEAACRRAIACHDQDRAAVSLDVRLLLAEVLERAHRTGEARRERSEVGRRQGVTTRRCLGETAEARILLVAGSGLCNLPTDFLVDRTRFDIVILYLPPADDPGLDAAERVASLPPADIAFNIVGDADAGAPFLERADALRQRLSCPMLNPPRHIPPTRRDQLAVLLGDIPGLVVPPMIRVPRDELVTGANTMRDRLTLPLLIRPAGSHGGVSLMRVETHAHLAAAVAAAPAEDYYASEYWDYRSADGWFRKYRLVFVDGEIFPVHLAISAGWLVHYWRADMAGWMQREEETFLADYRTIFAGAAGEALQSVAHRLDLDFGGIDCALLRDGRVLLFEANATMLVHTTGAFAAKRDQAVRIRDAMSRRILRVAKQGENAHGVFATDGLQCW
jgi:tetratricopeptide (TPR) repeat protein